MKHLQFISLTLLLLKVYELFKSGWEEGINHEFPNRYKDRISFLLQRSSVSRNSSPNLFSIYISPQPFDRHSEVI